MPSTSQSNAASIAPLAMIPECKRTLKLALPIIAGNLAGLGMSFVDTVMAGRIGATALGAVSIGGAVWSAVFLFVLGTSMALPPAVAQLDGAGQQRQGGLIARQALWLSLLLAALLMSVCRNAYPILIAVGIDAAIIPVATEYLLALSWGAPAVCGFLALRFFSEGSGHTRPVMYVGALGALCNIPLNYWFIHGGLGLPAMGAVGVGWASATVYWLQFFAWLWWVSQHQGYRPYALFERFDWPRWSDIKELLKVGLPIGGMIAVEGSLFVAAAFMIGRLGQIPVAGHQVALNFASLVFMVPLGLSSAISVRVGNAIGRGDPNAARYQGLLGIALAVALQTVGISAMIFFPEPIVGLYTKDLMVTQIALELIVLAAIFQWPDCIQVAAAGALRGLKDTRIPMIYTVVAYWLVGITTGYSLTFHYQWGAPGMWVGMIAGLSVAAVLLVVRFLRSSKKRIEAVNY